MAKKPATVISHADLLRCQEAGLELDDQMVRCLGFVKNQPSVEHLSHTHHTDNSPAINASDESIEASPTERASDTKVQDPVFWVAQIEQRNSNAHAVSRSMRKLTSTRSADADASREFALPYRPILNRKQRQYQVEQLFSDTRINAHLDLHATTQRMSRLLPADLVHGSAAQSGAGELIVLLDVRECLYPLYLDYHLALDALQSRWGRDLTHPIYLPSGITGGFLSPMYGSLDTLPPQSTLVLLSDVVQPDRWASQARAYAGFQSQCLRHGHRCVHWQHADSSPNQFTVHALLAAVAQVSTIGVHRLRAMRTALDAAGLATSAADELALWNHADRKLHSQFDWELSLEGRYRWYAEFERLNAKLQGIIRRVLALLSEQLPPDLRCIEDMLAATFDGEGAPEATPLLEVLQLLDNDQSGLAENFLLSHLDCFRVAAPEFEHRPGFSTVYQTVDKLSQRRGMSSLSDKQSSETQQGESTLSLVQQGSDLRMLKDPGSRLVLHQSIGPWIDQRTGRVLVDGDSLNATPGMRLLVSEQRLQLQRCTKPRWAYQISSCAQTGTSAWNESGLCAKAAITPVSLQHEDDDNILLMQTSPTELHWNVEENSLAWATEMGIDALGLWSEIAIGNVSQRLRWIAPGEFMMGSPEDEPERNDNELLHHVRLTEGYWLAETACSQALWEAVMGNNPSYFKGADRPVEQVSWEDVQQFIDQLNKRVPGLQSQLPTEAQWEYAARAGSQSPFWWGSALTPEQANYDGNHPYSQGEKGQFRRETVPVKAFEPNPWGLYQVHGNVWEWCEDRYDEYETDTVENPRVAERGVSRVCRGGSWFYGGGGLRAAFRFHVVPDYRFNFLGFRLCAGQSRAEPQ